MEPVENLLKLPWMVVEAEGANTLLVSAPDGVVLDFNLSPAQAGNIQSALSNSGLWSAFFYALIGSLPVE